MSDNEQMPWTGEERRKAPFTAMQIEYLETKLHDIADEAAEKAAEKAAKKAIDQGYAIYKEKMANEMSLSVGRWVISKVLYGVGAFGLGMVYWLHTKGFLKF